MSDDHDDPAHTHRFRLARIVDQCHYQDEIYRCECGSRKTVHIPRDFNDGTQRAYAREDCNNCQAKLSVLAPPAHWKTTL